MKIGILGSDNIRRSLCILSAEQGHEVFFSGRTTEKGQAVAEIAKNNTQGGTNDETAKFGEVLLYTIRGVDLSMGRELGSYTTISVRISAAKTSRLGRRQASNLY